MLRPFKNCCPRIFAGLLALVPVVCPAADQWNFETLMGELAEVSHARLEFAETKKSIFLIVDTTIEGEMEYRAPDYIVKETLSPFKEKVTIDGEYMSIEKTPSSGKSETQIGVQNYSVDSHPLLKAAVESMRAMLAGNYAMINDNYDIDFQGERENWSLSLTPLQPQIQEHIERLDLVGSDTMIAKVVTIQADGDITTLELSYIFVN